MATSTLQLFSCIMVDPLSLNSPYHGYYLIHDMTQRHEHICLPQPNDAAHRSCELEAAPQAQTAGTRLTDVVCP